MAECEYLVALCHVYKIKWTAGTTCVKVNACAG